MIGWMTAHNYYSCKIDGITVADDTGRENVGYLP
jgi:hypothetical protein